MSRSFAKKYKILPTSGFGKKMGNKKVRRLKGFDVDGNTYKKVFDSWNINDGGKAHPIPKGDETWMKKARRK